ncbi:MAG TPA: hypothetical protein VHD85_06295 [Terracidiphilus sp.]|nr:hypothetical protein [Terracidiphilus sp.]
MKIRIKGDSLRLRVLRSELDRLLTAGRIEETIHFPAGPNASLTYALEIATGNNETSVCYRQGEIVVVLAASDVHIWAQEDRVGVYKELHNNGRIFSLMVEKDFACLDETGEDQSDTFANPHHAGIC